MKVTADNQRAISVILIYLALLFFLIGIAAHFKLEVHGRLEISTLGFVIAAVLAIAGAITLVLSFSGRKS